MASNIHVCQGCSWLALLSAFPCPTRAIAGRGFSLLINDLPPTGRSWWLTGQAIALQGENCLACPWLIGCERCLRLSANHLETSVVFRRQTAYVWTFDLSTSAKVLGCHQALA